MIMEGLVKARRCESKTASSPLAMHRDSHEITKFKPKIRIIHIFAPEIIKTDVENFRELVQRLTGKPSTDQNSRNNNNKQRTRNTKITTHQEPPRPVYFNPTVAAIMEQPQYGYQTSWSSEESIIKHEEQDIMWGGGGENSSTGFYNGFGDFEGFIQGLSEFPLLPFSASSSSSSQSQVDLFGESCLSQ